MIKLGKEE